MELKIFKNKEIKIDFSEAKAEELFKSKVNESNFAKMIEKYKDEISYLVIHEENFNKETLAAALLVKEFYYVANNNDLHIYRSNEITRIDYLEKNVSFVCKEEIDNGNYEDDMFHDAYFEYLFPLQAEDYEKYRKMFKIVDILVPEHYGASYKMIENEKTIKLEKHFNTGEVWEILMNGSAVASGVKGYIDNLKIDEGKETEYFSEKFIPKEFKDKKLRADNVFRLEGNKGSLDFKGDESLVEGNYGNLIFDILTETGKMIFSNENEEEIQEALKYFLLLIKKVKEYVGEKAFEQVEKILRKNIKTEYSKMLEKLKDVNF